jgi:lysophospholipase L1-like esterase
MSRSKKKTISSRQPRRSAAMTRGHWFENNPKKTLFGIVFFCILGMVLLTEKYLSSQGKIQRSGLNRHIRLMDHEPLSSQFHRPTHKELQMADSLVDKRYLFRVDENGYIMPSKIHPDPDLTLCFMGGSTTECRYVEEENRFPYLTGRLLEQATKLKVNSYNAGRGGINSFHTLNLLLNKVIPLQPDIVVVMHNVNDLTILLYEKTYWSNNPTKSPIGDFRPSISNILTLMRDLWIPNLHLQFKNLTHEVKEYCRYRLGLGPSPEDEFKHIRGVQVKIDKPFLLQEITMNLTSIIQLCRTRNIIPVLMTQESRFKEQPDPAIMVLMQQVEAQGISYKDYKEIFDQINQTIRDIGKKHGVRVIDLAQKIPQEKEFIYDIVHFNDNGSRLAAQIISEELKSLVASLKVKK